MLAQIDTCDDDLRIIFNGRLTFAENDEFRRVVQALEARDGGRVIFDLGALDYIDSAGMGMLLVARDEVAAQGGNVVLQSAAGQVQRMLHLARFGDFFTLEQ